MSGKVTLAHPLQGILNRSKLEEYCTVKSNWQMYLVTKSDLACNRSLSVQWWQTGKLTGYCNVFFVGTNATEIQPQL